MFKKNFINLYKNSSKIFNNARRQENIDWMNKKIKKLDDQLKEQFYKKYGIVLDDSISKNDLRYITVFNELFQKHHIEHDDNFLKEWEKRSRNSFYY